VRRKITHYLENPEAAFRRNSVQVSYVLEYQLNTFRRIRSK